MAVFHFSMFTRAYRMSSALCLFFFIIGIALGYGAWQEDPELVKTVFETVIKQLQTLSEQMSNIPWFGQTLIIFMNNLRVSLLMIFVGSIIPFIPFVVVFSNGMFPGIMAAYVEESQIMTPGAFFLSLAPHGIFEITAIILSATVGVVWGMRNWFRWLDIKPSTGFFKNMKNAVAFFPLILVLLLIAAFVEILISPYLLPSL